MAKEFAFPLFFPFFLSFSFFLLSLDSNLKIARTMMEELARIKVTPIAETAVSEAKSEMS